MASNATAKLVADKNLRNIGVLITGVYSWHGGKNALQLSKEGSSVAITLKVSIVA
jgi:hypothetical protein